MWIKAFNSLTNFPTTVSYFMPKHNRPWLVKLTWYYFTGAHILGVVQMLSSAGDAHLGGRDIDAILADHFSTHFKATYRIDAKNNARAMVRLLAEVEKLKKQMSANSTMLPINIECFMDDKDVRGEMKR